MDPAEKPNPFQDWASMCCTFRPPSMPVQSPCIQRGLEMEPDRNLWRIWRYRNLPDIYVTYWARKYGWVGAWMDGCRRLDRGTDRYSRRKLTNWHRCTCQPLCVITEVLMHVYLHTYLHSRSASHCFLFSIPSHRVPFCFTTFYHIPWHYVA